MPIHVPMVDVHTIGAGGGSIASVDAAGMLRVGPESAGARPGPICYGRGGTRAHHHRRQPDPGPAQSRSPAGRRPSGDPRPCARPDRGEGRQAARPRRRCGAPPPSCASPTTAWPAPSAWCRCRAATIRATSRCSPSAARGRLHATALARELAIPTVLVPARPGITNALGCVVADLRHDYVRTVNKPLSALDDATIARHLCRAGGRGPRDDRRARACRCASCAAC